MTTERRKTILIMAGTLVIGILIGVLATGMLARQHYHERGERGMRGGKEMGRDPRKGFTKKLLEIVQADSSQVPTLKPILEETMKRIDGIQSHSRVEVQQVIDSLEVRLQPVLRADQLERLKKFHEEKKKERGERWKK